MTEGQAGTITPLRQADLDELRLLVTAGDRRATTREMLQAIIASSVLRLAEHAPLIPHGIDNEAVHQARVATRRLRSDLRTFADLLGEDWSDALRAELSWLAALLGEVRDADVLFDRMIGSLAEIDGPPTGRRVILHRLAARRDAARATMLGGLAGVRYPRLVASLRSAALAPKLRGAADEPAAEAMPGFARRPWKKLHGAVGRLGDNPSEDELHAVRIAAKRARYAAEAVEPLAGAPARRYAAAVAALQGALGDYHDAVVARQWLEQAAPTLRRGGPYYARALAAREKVRGEEALGQWRDAWKWASKAASGPG